MSDPAWSCVLLVEGTAGIGKSTLLGALARRYVALDEAYDFWTGSGAPWGEEG